MPVSENKRSFKRRTFLLAAEVHAHEARPLDRAFRFSSGVELPKSAPVERTAEFAFSREVQVERVIASLCAGHPHREKP